LTAFIVLNNRRGIHGLAGASLPAVDAWCTAHFGRDTLQFCQVLTARFNAGFLSLRTVSAGRLFVRASVYQAGVRVATMALRFDPPQRRAHIN